MYIAFCICECENLEKMVGEYEALKFKYLHGFDCPSKHRQKYSLKKQSANPHTIRFQLEDLNK